MPFWAYFSWYLKSNFYSWFQHEHEAGTTNQQFQIPEAAVDKWLGTTPHGAIVNIGPGIANTYKQLMDDTMEKTGDTHWKEETAL